PRPALVSGLPGMGLPARGKGMNYRRLMDAFIAHSFAEAAPPSTGPAASSASAPHAVSVSAPAAPRTLVFAPQAKVPAERADREAIIAALAGFADRHDGSRTVIKMRSRPGEFETHHEQHSYVEILEGL